jgi:hypothetical protein
MGPSNYIVTEASKAQSLANLFLAVIPKSVFVEVARLTDKYCYKDFVVERTAKDSRGNVKKKKVLTHCDASTPEARHRTKNEEKKYGMTPGFVLAWLLILIINGAHFGSDKKSSRKRWRSSPHGLYMPYIQNSMTRNAFEFMRRYTHFCDNDKRKAEGKPGYDPLFKVKWIMDEILKGI